LKEKINPDINRMSSIADGGMPSGRTTFSPSGRLRELVRRVSSDFYK